MKIKIYNWLMINFEPFLDWLFFGISKKDKSKWINDLNTALTLIEIEFIEDQIKNRLPYLSRFRTRIEYQCHMKRRKMNESNNQ
jgi:hypothetical protein